MIVDILLRIFFITVSVYLAFFTLWRTVERENVDDIPLAVDRVILAGLIALYLARIPSCVDLLLRHAISPFSVLNPFVGDSSWQIAIILFCVAFYSLLRENWRDKYALLDFAVITVSVFLAGSFFGQLVTYLVSSLFTTISLSWPYVVVLLLGVIFFVLFSRLLAYFERQYRAYFWYRYRRSSAQTGFVTSVFLIGTGLFGIIYTAYQLPYALVSLATFLSIWSLFTLVSGFVLLYIRSGRLKKR